MLYIGNSINYLSLEGLPWIIFAWIGLVFFRSLATLIHELGHLLGAFFLTIEEIILRVGQSSKSWKRKTGRVYWELSLLSGREGFTGYEKDNISKLRLFIIIALGPLGSLLMSLISAWIIFSTPLPAWVEVPLVSWFCANSLAFFRSILPFKLKPTQSFPDGPPSDGLELMRIVFGKHKQ